MRVFKFGGASIKDAEGVRNLVKILRKTGVENTVLIMSAMGKTTRALEAALAQYFDEPNRYKSSLIEIEIYHRAIVSELFGNSHHPVFELVRKLFKELGRCFMDNKSPNYSFVYDQTVSYGELISTHIITHYLEFKGIINDWVDVRELIKTDHEYRRANVNWPLTKTRIREAINSQKLTVTQGFIASDSNGFTTTLGREGSDYTAAIIANSLNAESVVIWKDVPGVMNADPHRFKNTKLITQMSYSEAIEFAFYGASVIHPRTLQPLQGKEIPLYVRPFKNPDKNGTIIRKGVEILQKGLVSF